MQYHAVILIFGPFLTLIGLKMMFAPERKLDPEKNPVIRLFHKLMPETTDLRRMCARKHRPLLAAIADEAGRG